MVIACAARVEEDVLQILPTEPIPRLADEGRCRWETVLGYDYLLLYPDRLALVVPKGTRDHLPAGDVRVSVETAAGPTRFWTPPFETAYMERLEAIAV